MPHRWSAALRLGFRFAFCYFMTYCLCNGNASLWEAIPYGGEYVSNWLSTPFFLSGQYLAQHLIHVQGAGAKLHSTGSGDTAINWIVFGEMLSLALVASLVWSAIDRRRQHYQTLAAWLRFVIRLTLGMGMVSYGFEKVFPLQMPPPMLAVLNEPLGNSSPMTMLWTLIGLNPAYEMVCGTAEVLAGVLILFRRTALTGALFTAFVTANIVLYNFFFDVPVKLYSTHLLLMALFVVLPDMGPLFRFFWRHEPSAPTGIWVPPARRRGFQIATTMIEIAFLVLIVGQSAWYSRVEWQKVKAARVADCPIRGGWRVNSAMVKGKPQPLLVGIDQPVTELYVQNVAVGQVRSAGGNLWRAHLTTDNAKHTVTWSAAGLIPVTYTFAMADPDHLSLQPAAKTADTVPALTLTRIPTAARYPLMERRFNLVSEWAHHR